MNKSGLFAILVLALAIGIGIGIAATELVSESRASEPTHSSDAAASKSSLSSSDEGATSANTSTARIGDMVYGPYLDVRLVNFTEWSRPSRYGIEPCTNVTVEITFHNGTSPAAFAWPDGESTSGVGILEISRSRCNPGNSASVLAAGEDGVFRAWTKVWRCDDSGQCMNRVGMTEDGIYSWQVR